MSRTRVVVRGAALAGLLAVGAAQAAVRAHLDSTSVAVGDTVQLTLERDGQSGEQPDLTPLRQDFEVLSTSRSNAIQITNGTMVSHTQLIAMLSPKHAGQLTVPAIEWSGETTAPLTLTVSAAAPGAQKTPGNANPARKVFLEASVDLPEPYVQQAVRVTVRIYRGETVYKAALDFPASNDALIEQIQADEHRTVERNGQAFDLVERHYLLFPQRSGALSLPGPVLEGQITVNRNDSFGNDPFANFFGASPGLMGGTKPIRVQADPLVLNVRPRPANSGAGPWLPARELKLTGEWRPDTGAVHVGDPVTLDLEMQAEGLTSTQLPDLPSLLKLPVGLKAYPDQAKLDNAVHGDSVQGSHKQSVALIADQPGDYHIPALHLAWWDTATNENREVTLPEHDLHVLPATTTAAAAPSAPNAATGGEAGRAAVSSGVPAAETSLFAGNRTTLIWVAVSAALAGAWLATLVAWALSRRRAGGASAGASPPGGAAAANAAAPSKGGPTPKAAAHPTPAPRSSDASGAGRMPASAGAARSQFHEACRRNDAPAARRNLLAWVSAAWPEDPAPGLGALAKRLGDPTLAHQLLELDRACYGGDSWDGQALLAALHNLPPRPVKTGGGGDGGGLAPLYP
jgi:hypothetical protein